MLLMMGKKGLSYRQTLLDTSPLIYFPLDEISGTAAINYGSLGASANGTYSGPTLNQLASPGGGNAPLFDGLNDYVDIYSAALSAAFNPQLGTLMFWWKVFDKAVWYDALNACAINLGASSTNVLQVTQYNSHQMTYVYRAGGTYYYPASPMPGGEGWCLSTITWNKTSDLAKGYLNEKQWGDSTSTIGTWTGSLADTLCAIGGSNTTPTNPWKGYLAHVAIWDKELAL
jgi:hypothetical protein